MKKRIVMMLCTGMIVLGCGHDPNQGIDAAKAQEAADRVHTPPDPNAKTEPGHGG